MSELETLDKQIQDLKDVGYKLDDQVRKLEQQKRSLITKEWDELPRDKVLTYLLQCYYSTGGEIPEIYNSFRKWCDNHKGIHAGGTYNVHTKQRAIAVSINKDFSDVELLTLSTLIHNEILPCLIPTPETIGNKADRYKKLDIWEYTLSEDGVYEIINKDDKFAIIKTSYGRTDIISEWDSLFMILKIIRENYYAP